LTDAESSQRTKQDKEVCPVCGEEYTHKREEDDDYATYVLRSDREECRVNRSSPVGDDPANTVYVHESQPVTSITRVKDSGAGETTLLDKLLGGSDE
jgi:hypothetical protein